MSPLEFASIANNISVTVPTFRVKLDIERTLDAKKADGSDRFITQWEGGNPGGIKDIKAQFYRLNSSGRIETNDEQERMPPWTMHVSELTYCGETQLSMAQWNDEW